jgi:hypothetical protein
MPLDFNDWILFFVLLVRVTCSSGVFYKFWAVNENHSLGLETKIITVCYELREAINILQLQQHTLQPCLH